MSSSIRMIDTATVHVPEPREWLLTRRCARCEETKPWAMFTPERYWPDGTVRSVRSYCKTCEADRMRAASYPSMSRESRNEAQRRYRRRRTEALRAQTSSRGPLVDARPFQRWLAQRYGEVGTWGELAALTGANAGLLRQVSRRSKRVTLELVDRCLTAMGEHITDLYPDHERGRR